MFIGKTFKDQLIPEVSHVDRISEWKIFVSRNEILFSIDVKHCFKDSIVFNA